MAEEMSAIAMNADTLQIVSVFHEFAKSHISDQWGRKHIHGLNQHWLIDNAKYDSEKQLVQAFLQWYKGFRHVLTVFANAPAREISLIGHNIHIDDISLPSWEHRERRACHQTALYFKRANVPILNRRCSSHAHSSYKYFPVYRNSTTEMAKKRWMHHCSLYDVFETYLYFIEERTLSSSC